jgi:protein-L-isoaspartate(D-aspartate) O-methyltransferase
MASIPEREPNREGVEVASAADRDWEAAQTRARLRMARDQIEARGVRDQRVLDAIRKVPRHRFVPLESVPLAYADQPLPIGAGQTISQPYIVALMTELARPQPEDRALDVGSGSGYQAAVLAELVREVQGLEINEALAQRAGSRLRQLGYHNVEIRHGNGYQGWIEQSPYQIILVAAAPDHVPQPLIDQLAPGGRLVLPVGRHLQELRLIEKQLDGSLVESVHAAVNFVPMTGDPERR